MIDTKDLSFEREGFYIIFDGLRRPKVWDVFYKIIKWCNSYTTFHLSTLEINKNFVHYFLGVNTFITEVKWIYVTINKPNHRLDYENQQIKIFKANHRLDYENQQIKIFKDMIISKFKRSKPIFEKELPKRLKEKQEGEQRQKGREDVACGLSNSSIPLKDKSLVYP